MCILTVTNTISNHKLKKIKRNNVRNYSFSYPPVFFILIKLKIETRNSILAFFFFQPQRKLKQKSTYELIQTKYGVVNTPEITVFVWNNILDGNGSVIIIHDHYFFFYHTFTIYFNGRF